MASSDNKTKPTSMSVDDFIAAVVPALRKADALTLRQLLERLTDCPAVMWGPSIVGFDTYHYRYDSGREGDMPLVAFSPRKPASVLYIHGSFPERAERIARLGPVTTKGGCVYVKSLAQIDMAALEAAIRASIGYLRAN